VLALLLIAVSVGLDNFGASAAIGVAGVDRALRLRIALIFGTFEAAMPVAGILLGHSVTHDLGGAAHPLGGAVLGAAGIYAIVNEVVGEKADGKAAPAGVKRLVVIGAALSIDNLVIGFALGTIHVNLLVAAITIGVVSVALSLLGLEIGNRLGGRFGERSELIGGAVLVLVGVGVGTGLL
jgi:manganese efflux pump family protein